MVVAMLQTLLGILQRELTHFEEHRLVLSTGSFEKATPQLKYRRGRQSEASNSTAVTQSSVAPPEKSEAAKNHDA
jgi:hypothetical protein